MAVDRLVGFRSLAQALPRALERGRRLIGRVEHAPLDLIALVVEAAELLDQNAPVGP